MRSCGAIVYVVKRARLLMIYAITLSPRVYVTDSALIGIFLMGSVAKPRYEPLDLAFAFWGYLNERPYVRKSPLLRNEITGKAPH